MIGIQLFLKKTFLKKDYYKSLVALSQTGGLLLWPLAFRQINGHGASCFSRGPVNFGEVGFSGPWVSAVSALVLLPIMQFRN